MIDYNFSMPLLDGMLVHCRLGYNPYLSSEPLLPLDPQHFHESKDGAMERDGTVVRALASYQCGPGFIPGPSNISGLSLLLILILAPGVFSGFSSFPPSTKTSPSNFQFD